VHDEIAPALVAYLKDFSSPLLRSIRLEERAIFQARWSMLIGILLDFCGVTRTMASASIDFCVEVLDALVKAIKSLRLADRDTRIALWQDLDIFLNSIPSDYSTKDPENEQKEDKLMAALKPFHNNYWLYLLQRRATRIGFYKRFATEGARFILQTLSELVQRQHETGAVMGVINSLTQTSVRTEYGIISTFLGHMLEQNFPNVPDVQLTAPIRSLLVQVGFRMVDNFDYFLDSTRNKQLLKFFDSVVEMAQNGMLPLTTDGIAARIIKVVNSMCSRFSHGYGKSITLDPHVRELTQDIFAKMLATSGEYAVLSFSLSLSLLRLCGCYLSLIRPIFDSLMSCCCYFSFPIR
jgi:hypothetical protein